MYAQSFKAFSKAFNVKVYHFTDVKTVLYLLIEKILSVAENKNKFVFVTNPKIIILHQQLSNLKKNYCVGLLRLD